MSSQDWSDKAKFSEVWYDKGKQILDIIERLAYYRAGLNLSSEFHPYAWHGIGEALHIQGDFSGASDAFKNEEKTRQGLEPSPSPYVRNATFSNPPTSQTFSSDAKFCPNCGASLPAGTQFCSRCGAQISTASIVTPAYSTQNAPYQPAPYQSSPYQQGYYPQAPYQGTRGNVYGELGLL